MTKAEIKAAGLKLVTLATLAGVTPSQVSRWANGHEPTPGYADTILLAWTILTSDERARLVAAAAARNAAKRAAT